MTHNLVDVGVRLRFADRGQVVLGGDGRPRFPALPGTAAIFRLDLETNRRLAQHIRGLEHRPSELLGQQAFERSGLGAPTSTAAFQAELEQQRQTNLDLKRAGEERDEELAAARETNRRLMNQLNRCSAS